MTSSSLIKLHQLTQSYVLDYYQSYGSIPNELTEIESEAANRARTMRANFRIGYTRSKADAHPDSLFARAETIHAAFAKQSNPPHSTLLTAANTVPTTTAATVSTATSAASLTTSPATTATAVAISPLFPMPDPSKTKYFQYFTINSKAGTEIELYCKHKMKGRILKEEESVKVLDAVAHVVFLRSTTMAEVESTVSQNCQTLLGIDKREMDLMASQFTYLHKNELPNSMQLRRVNLDEFRNEALREMVAYATLAKMMNQPLHTCLKTFAYRFKEGELENYATRYAREEMAPPKKKSSSVTLANDLTEIEDEAPNLARTMRANFRIGYAKSKVDASSAKAATTILASANTVPTTAATRSITATSTSYTQVLPKLDTSLTAHFKVVENESPVAAEAIELYCRNKMTGTTLTPQHSGDILDAVASVVLSKRSNYSEEARTYARNECKRLLNIDDIELDRMASEFSLTYIRNPKKKSSSVTLAIVAAPEIPQQNSALSKLQPGTQNALNAYFKKKGKPNGSELMARKILNSLDNANYLLNSFQLASLFPDSNKRNKAIEIFTVIEMGARNAANILSGKAKANAPLKTKGKK